MTPNFGSGQSFIGSRDIINIVSTCLPSKKCPRRVCAAAFFFFPFWDSFFFAPLLLLGPIPLKMRRAR